MACLIHSLFLAASLSSFVSAEITPRCKANPLDGTWPSDQEWQHLNSTINGTLLSTTPVASSCYPGNPFNSQISCNTTSSQWSNSFFHQQLPESIGATIFANDSCLPPSASSYIKTRGCHLGGLPSYVVNATTNEQVATAMKWAADHNVRVVVKGTGHDLSGRSSGAFGLSIWTKQFRELRREKRWYVPGQNRTEDVFIAGSGLVWGDVLDFALEQGRVVTTGQDPSVGLGGYIQGGGHGPLASTVGLASQQVLQVVIVTSSGEVLTANEVENEDLFWAVRGGGGGQYGVVMEYVIRHFPVPENVVMGTLSIAPKGGNDTRASWDAAAYLVSQLPDLMDAGLAGAATLSSGETAKKFNPSLTSRTDGAVLTQIFWSFNTTQEEMNNLVNPIMTKLQSYDPTNTTLTLSWSASAPTNYTSFYTSISGSNTAGSGGVSSSRLLGRPQLTSSHISHEQLRTYLQRSVLSQNTTAGTYATIGLSGGPGVQSAESSRWGALHPSWREAYLHIYVGGASAALNGTNTPQDVLDDAAAWIEREKEGLWREWAPGMGAYMNEANPFNSMFRKDFYGDYERLGRVKERWDPTSSLFVVSGVGSEGWKYDLDSGKLCRV